MIALVVGNRGDSDTGFIGARLTQLGFRFLRNEREYPRSWASLAGVDLLLLLGSDWSVYWDSNQREMAAESDLVRVANLRGIPIFAICYGAQLLAHTFGGRVWKLNEPEIGWKGVLSATHQDYFQRVWWQWHSDAFSVPDGFCAVASNEIGAQAMTGPRMLATQFHPEADISIISRWSSGAGMLELRELGMDVPDVIEHSRSFCAETSSAASTLVDWFLEYSSKT